MMGKRNTVGQLFAISFQMYLDETYALDQMAEGASTAWQRGTRTDVNKTGSQ